MKHGANSRPQQKIATKECLQNLWRKKCGQQASNIAREKWWHSIK